MCQIVRWKKHLGIFLTDEKYERIFARNKSPIRQKSSTSNIYNHSQIRIKINSEDELIHETMILAKYVFNNKYNHRYT